MEKNEYEKYKTNMLQKQINEIEKKLNFKFWQEYNRQYPPIYWE